MKNILSTILVVICMSKVQASDPNVIKLQLKDDGTIPNNANYPLVLLKNAVQFAADPASELESLFRQNGWSGSWRNGIYSYHHYHSNTHEVLGCYSGSATVQFGGPEGETLEFAKGDVVIIPAGVAHKKLSSGPDFSVVGAYPEGRRWDMNYGKAEEREQAIENINKVSIPKADPVFGKDGPLIQVWGE